MVGCFGSLFHRAKAVDEQSGRPIEQTPALPAVDIRTHHTQPLSLPSYLEYDACCGDILHERQFVPHTKTESLPPYTASGPTLSPEIRKTIQQAIKSYSAELTSISLYLSDNPELGFKEFKAHDKITSYLEAKEFDVKRSYFLPTAFRASYTHGKGGRTFGLNSEYDALPGIGHACGHNLIAVAGVAALLGIRDALIKHDIPGTVVLLGTPAEEGGGGKVILLEKGAYDQFDAVTMVHPGGDQAGTGAVAPTLAVQSITVEYFGKTSHAAIAPWEGVNALDAANIAYQSISALRQQIKPTARVHGIIADGGQAANIIPAYTKLKYGVRAPTASEVEALSKRIIPAFEAAALATGAEVKIHVSDIVKDLRNNKSLAEEYVDTLGSLYNIPVSTSFDESGVTNASTDFGNVTYALPALHPMFGIPTVPGRANHTPEFTEKARSPEAHEETWKAATGIASAGIRVLADEEFAEEVKHSWEESKKDLRPA